MHKSSNFDTIIQTVSTTENDFNSLMMSFYSQKEEARRSFYDTCHRQAVNKKIVEQRLVLARERNNTTSNSFVRLSTNEERRRE